jgi:hypothetical protein
LVTHRSSQKRTRKPIGERASSKLRDSVCADLYAATKPKARSPMGFLLCGLTRSIGRALAVAVGGKLYYGKDVETEQGVAKIVPLHRTTVGSCGSEWHM